jgi:HlyD family secretion protein
MRCGTKEDCMFKKVFIPLVIVLIIVGVILVKAKNSANGRDNDIKMVKVQKGDIIEKALAIGQIEPDKEIAIKSKISGIVRRVYVEVGDKVQTGQPLLEIKPDPTPLEYAEAKRNVELATVSLEKASNEYNRMKKLLKDSLVSQKEYDLAENDYKQSKLRLNLAQERLALIEKGRTKIADRQIDTVIKSPVEGTVLERRVNEGDPVVPLTSYQAGTELLILADMKGLIFKGTVDEIDVGKLEEGMMAELKIGAIPDQRIVGELSKISPKAKRQENATLFDVEITITQKGEKIIRAGYSANADLVINKSVNTLFIPERLVEFKDNQTFVEVKDGKGEIIKKEVKIGLSDGINIEITEGLGEGDEVVERPPKEIK